ncbi:MAG: S-adenosylmethionine:tRNA ribosyltransferase-isomerase, partial [Dialister micraerophilus]|nr:S-adenosylmethionine:tRNA ribosyltransferase-isomerase [Dialister micraerophilus]
MKLENFNYELPESLIAQEPVEPRDSCKLMVLDKETGHLSHHVFTDILDEIKENDLIVFNNTKVIPARLNGYRKQTGGKVEVLLLTPKGNDEWEV